MASTEERLQILKMIQSGKLTAEEGARLIEAIEKSTGRAQVARPPLPDELPMPPGGRGNRWFRVRITDTDNGKVRVNVRLPVSLINAGIKMGAKFSPEVEGLDLSQLTEFINSGSTGQIVDVWDEEDGEHVEVFIE